MEQAVHDLQAHLQAHPVTLHPHGTNFEAIAAEQVSKMGLDPNMSRFATYMATLQIKSEYESKLSRDMLTKGLLSTINTVNNNTQDIAQLKQTVSQAETCYTHLQTNQDDIYKEFCEIKALAKKSYLTAAENKQRSSKGNFIVSGDGIPRYTPNENLFDKIFPFIHEKYGIWVYHQELKALHRLPNNKVIFSLHSRLPGCSFEKLIHAMNSNPKSHIKVYVTIQLFDPYSELFYIARRLKYYNIITNYRLDENGHTNIALR